MSGYLSFSGTGSPLIDAILQALESAGDAYHNTVQWDEPAEEGGPSYIELIQQAANAAAAALTASPQAAPEGCEDCKWNPGLCDTHDVASPQVQGGEADECETCGGVGTVDLTLGGYAFSDPKARCPDCDGLGERATPQRAPGVSEAMVERAFKAMRGYDCFFIFGDNTLRKLIREWLEAALASGPSGVCEHEWVDARNRYVQSGELCLKCNAIRAAQDQGGGRG
jgi:hypothetical protein